MKNEIKKYNDSSKKKKSENSNSNENHQDSNGNGSSSVNKQPSEEKDNSSENEAAPKDGMVWREDKGLKDKANAQILENNIKAKEVAKNNEIAILSQKNQGSGGETRDTETYEYNQELADEDKKAKLKINELLKAKETISEECSQSEKSNNHNKK